LVEPVLNLAQRLVEVNKDLGWVKKRGENKAQNYDFVRAVDVFADARDALNKHGVLWTFSVSQYDILEVAGKVWHKMSGDYALINVDDPKDVIAGSVAGSAQPPGDKGAWVVTTGMLKYALIQAFLLPTGDDPENDSQSSDTSPRVSPTAVTRPAPTDVKVGLNEAQKRKLFAAFDGREMKEKESRRFIIKTLTGKESTTQMSGADMDRVLAYLAETTDEADDLWVKALAAA
jgi:hypothetical protein